jgi:hypothetical protein
MAGGSFCVLLLCYACGLGWIVEVCDVDDDE